MRGIGQFIRQVLAGPVLVVFTIAPESRFTHIVNDTLVSDPDFFPVLPVAQCQLRTAKLFQFH